MFSFARFVIAFLNVILAIFIIEAALIHSNYDSQVVLLKVKHLRDY